MADKIEEKVNLNAKTFESYKKIINQLQQEIEIHKTNKDWVRKQIDTLSSNQSTLAKVSFINENFDKLDMSRMKDFDILKNMIFESKKISNELKDSTKQLFDQQEA